jgi:hypothetical protein
MNFTGTNLVTSELVNQTDTAQLSVAPGSTLANQLFNVG